MKSIVSVLFLVLFLVVLSGCAAIQTSVSKKDLDTQSKMSKTIFLEPTHTERERTVFLQVRNTSDQSDFDITQKLESAIINRGYRVVHKLSEANYLVQANVLQVGKSSPNAAEAAIYKGYGMDGVAIGASTAYVAGASSEVMVGAGILGGLASVIADSAVKDVYYSVIVDIQIKKGREKFQTRILSSANKVNLKLAEALPALKDGITKSIAGIF